MGMTVMVARRMGRNERIGKGNRKGGYKQSGISGEFGGASIDIHSRIYTGTAV
jgi:hypothetical protein